jgi:hypothetical protein
MHVYLNVYLNYFQIRFEKAVKKDESQEGPSLKKIFNTAAGSLGKYLVNLSTKHDESKK